MEHAFRCMVNVYLLDLVVMSTCMFDGNDIYHSVLCTICLFTFSAITLLFRLMSFSVLLLSIVSLFQTSILNGETATIVI